MFRETLWFKRGELDDEVTPLPLEDRYLDDGQVTSMDSFEWGVRTGETRRLPPEVLRACKLDPEPEMAQLVREMKPRNAWIAAAAATLAVLGAVLVLAI